LIFDHIPSPGGPMGPNALSGVEAPRPVQIFTTPEAIKQYARQLQPRKLWYRIDPRTSRRLQYWDALTTLALLFTALVTPYESCSKRNSTYSSTLTESST